MIAFVSGVVRARGTDWVVIETGGIGYRVETPAAVAAHSHVGEQLLLHTQLVVREDSHTLYGFDSTESLEMFNVLLSVNGVGPKSALGVLSTLSPAEIAHAVASEDEKPFKQVSGIGPKSAKLILVSLSGKLDHILLQHPVQASTAAADPHTELFAQVVTGLTGLGWAEKDALQAVTDAAATGADSSAQELLRAALVILQNR